MLLQTLMQLSQMYTPGPAMSLRTSAWLLPQKEHIVRLEARAIESGLRFIFHQLRLGLRLHFLARFHDFIHEAVGFRLLSVHVVVAIGIEFHLFKIFAG